MAAIDYPLHVHRTGDGKILQLELNSQEVRNAVWDLVERAEKKHGGFIRSMFDLPAKPVRTGPRGQVNRHYGHCTDLAAQLSTEEHKVTKEMVDGFLRKLAVKEGYPTFYNVLEDSVEPAHFNSQLSIEHANIVERVKQRYADGDNRGHAVFWLTEYHEEKDEKGKVVRLEPYKSIQGRSKDEMEVYWREQGRGPDGSDPGDAGAGVPGAGREVLDLQDADELDIF